MIVLKAMGFSSEENNDCSSATPQRVGQIFVKLINGRTCTVTVTLDESIRWLKYQLYDMEGYDPQAVHLYRRSEKLYNPLCGDDVSLYDAGVRLGDFLPVLFGINGGMPPTAQKTAKEWAAAVEDLKKQLAKETARADSERRKRKDMERQSVEAKSVMQSESSSIASMIQSWRKETEAKRRKEREEDRKHLEQQLKLITERHDSLRAEFKAELAKVQNGTDSNIPISLFKEVNAEVDRLRDKAYRDRTRDNIGAYVDALGVRGVRTYGYYLRDVRDRIDVPTVMVMSEQKLNSLPTGSWRPVVVNYMVQVQVPLVYVTTLTVTYDTLYPKANQSDPFSAPTHPIRPNASHASSSSSNLSSHDIQNAVRAEIRRQLPASSPADGRRHLMNPALFPDTTILQRFQAMVRRIELVQ